ncbi:hypothetical protein YC2023_040800 [Brassica napus]
MPSLEIPANMGMQMLQADGYCNLLDRKKRKKNQRNQRDGSSLLMSANYGKTHSQNKIFNQYVYRESPNRLPHPRH